MAQPTLFPGLSGVRDRYDVLLCDIWGVVHNGRESFPEPCAGLVRWRAEVGPVVLISNSPRPSPGVVEQLDQLSVPRDSWSAIVTSGDATRALLAERAPGPVWRVGPERDAPLYEGLGLADAGPDACAFVSVTGPVDDETETAETYRDRLAVAAARGVTLICANPDRVVHRGDRLIPCGGALADLYAELGGPVLMAGKPYSPIYEASLAEAERLLGRAPDRARVLCIGDGLHTDVAGANGQNLDCLFVAAGIHAADLRDEGGRPDPARAGALLAREGVHAAWAATTLAW